MTPIPMNFYGFGREYFAHTGSLGRSDRFGPPDKVIYGVTAFAISGTLRLASAAPAQILYAWDKWTRSAQNPEPHLIGWVRVPSGCVLTAKLELGVRANMNPQGSKPATPPHKLTIRPSSAPEGHLGSVLRKKNISEPDCHVRSGTR